MSKNILIREGNLARQMNVDKLKTNLVEGGSCLWVPEEETRLVSKEITANGVYRPSDEGAYGFGEIIVNVQARTLTGISVTAMPTVLVYTAGETLDFEGLEVTALYSDETSEVVTEDCVLSPADGSTATLGVDTVVVTYTPDGGDPATTSFGITVNRQKRKVRAIQLMPTTYEESLAKIQSVLSIPNKMLQKIASAKSSVFGGTSLNIVLSAGYCNYKGSGSLRFTLSDITPYLGGNYLYQFTDPAPGVSQGVAIPSEYASYREFFPHQYFWENCSGNNFFYIVATEGEIAKDSAWTTPWMSDLCLGFGSDVFDYNPFSQTGGQPYQAYAANYMILEVDDPTDI